MVTSPDDSENTTIVNNIPPQPCPRTLPASLVEQQQQQQQQQQLQALAAQRMDAVMGLENFRFCSVLGRGHFGKVSHFYASYVFGLWALIQIKGKNVSSYKWRHLHS